MKDYGASCRVVSATTDGMGEGVAYRLWRRLEDQRVSLGWTKTRLAQVVGLPRSTYNDLATGLRPPLPRTVHAYADALKVDRVEAEQLAGLRPAPPAPQSGNRVSVRQAIAESVVFSPEQKAALLATIDAFEAANRPQSPPLPEDGSDDAQKAV